MELTVKSLQVLGRLTEPLGRLIFKHLYCFFNLKCQRQADGLKFLLQGIPNNSVLVSL